MRDTKAAGAPLRKVKLGPADVLLERNADGTIILRSPHKLGTYAEKLTERLEHWAEAAPERVFLAQRAADGSWRKLTYAQVLSQDLDPAVEGEQVEALVGAMYEILSATANQTLADLPIPALGGVAMVAPTMATRAGFLVIETGLVQQ